METIKLTGEFNALENELFLAQNTLLDMCQNELDMGIENGKTLWVLRDLGANGHTGRIQKRALTIIVNNMDALTPLLEDGGEA